MPGALYAAFFTGVAGQSIGLFYIGNGLLAGIDVATTQYDGSYSTKPDGSIEGVVEYVLPAGVSSITGSPTGVAPTRISLNLMLPVGFDDGRVVAIQTPVGPLNAKFQKIKEIP